MADLITFDDKVDLITTTAARINKSTAADWNEVKTVVNSHASDIEDLQATNANTGWAIYLDDQYTEGSPLTITEGQTVQITNNAANVINSQLPEGVNTFYDPISDRIQGINVGDAYTVRLSFKAKTNNNNGYAEIDFNIGASVGDVVILTESINFPRGQGVERTFTTTDLLYSLDTYVANGCAFEVRGIRGTTTIYDISIMVARIHKAASE